MVLLSVTVTMHIAEPLIHIVLLTLTIFSDVKPQNHQLLQNFDWLFAEERSEDTNNL